MAEQPFTRSITFRVKTMHSSDDTSALPSPLCQTNEFLSNIQMPILCTFKTRQRRRQLSQYNMYVYIYIVNIIIVNIIINYNDEKGTFCAQHRSTTTTKTLSIKTKCHRRRVYNIIINVYAPILL